MLKERVEELQGLGRQVLNEIGQQELQALIDENDENRATVYLLGAVDHCYYDGLDADTAAKYYKVLGVNPDRASRIRQKTNKI